MLFARKSDVEVSLNKHIRELPMVPPAILSPTPPPQRMSWRQQHRARAGGRQLCIQQRGGGDREGIMMVIVSSCVAATQARGNPQPIRGPGCPHVFPGFVFKSGFINYQFINGGGPPPIRTKSQKKRIPVGYPNSRKSRVIIMRRVP